MPCHKALALTCFYKSWALVLLFISINGIHSCHCLSHPTSHFFSWYSFLPKSGTIRHCICMYVNLPKSETIRYRISFNGIPSCQSLELFDITFIFMLFLLAELWNHPTSHFCWSVSAFSSSDVSSRQDVLKFVSFQDNKEHCLSLCFLCTYTFIVSLTFILYVLTCLECHQTFFSH